MEASETTTTTAAVAAPVGKYKRPLVLRHPSYEDDDNDDDDLDIEDCIEPVFVAGPDGACRNIDMPKRMHLGHEVGEASALMRAIDADDERSTGMMVRLKSEVAATIRDMKARASADAAEQRLVVG